MSCVGANRFRLGNDRTALSVYLNMIMGELWSRTGIVSDVSFRIKLPQTKIDSGLQVNQPRSDLVQRRD